MGREGIHVAFQRDIPGSVPFFFLELVNGVVFWKKDESDIFGLCSFVSLV